MRRGLIPQSRLGRITASIGMLGFLGAVASGVFYANRLLHQDRRFLLAASSSIELRGNEHLTRAQLLSIFGGDIDGNIFDVPMATRRDQLEQIPWVEHATVMRMLPNRIRVDVKERTPIAFVRQGGNIGMADASGVLLDIPPDAPGNPDYSFPVVTGLKPDDSPESREQRMHLYSAFLKDLDSEGKKVSADLSEVDLSDPEDIKALLPNANGETLVHFGTDSFLHRYKRFQEHIAEWRSQYPRLSSVDMRYERQVVLQMPPKDSTVASPTQPAQVANLKPSAIKPAAARSAPLVPPSPVASMPQKESPKTLRTKLVPTAHVVLAKPTRRRPEAEARGPASKQKAKQADVAKRLEVTNAGMARRHYPVPCRSDSVVARMYQKCARKNHQTLSLAVR